MLFLSSALVMGRGLLIPFVVASLDPIVDEMGFILEGNRSTQGDLVQVLQTDNGVIYPPGLGGDPDSRNTLLATTSIGKIAPNWQVQPGNFGYAIQRSSGDPIWGSAGDGVTKVFVRVFNAPSLRDASFYGDSQVFTLNHNEEFVANISATTLPLDSGDNDQDGMNNSMEKSMGTDPDNPDTDSDGMNDGNEHLAGTDPLDQYSLLMIVEMTPSGSDMVLRWDSVPGKRYRVEYTTDPLDADPDFDIVSDVIHADNDVSEITIIYGLLGPEGTFFVRVLGD